MDQDVRVCPDAEIVAAHLTQQEIGMNRDRFAGICQQLGGRLNEIRGELTNDPLRVAAGRRAQIFGKARQRSGVSKEESTHQLKDFLHRNRNWYI
ncbi:MAG: hypothetical protein Q8L40_06535 [Burkholderiales bacterium]|nr:hypothetical protein [Burkholderiales bacterium]